MRIVIDLQGAQAENRFRGIGRYTLAFAQAVVRNRGEHEIILALNDLFPETIEPIRAAFEGLLPQENIRVWYAPGPVKEEQPGNKTRRKVAELLREAFIAELQPDLLHITSLFEGYSDDAVTSVGRFKQAFPISVNVFEEDLIKQKTASANYDKFFNQKSHYIREINILLAESEYVKKQTITQFSIESSKVISSSNKLSKNKSNKFSRNHAVENELFINKEIQIIFLAWENLYKNTLNQLPLIASLKIKPRLAFVSPLPPERTGIADYSAELILELSKHYEITLVVDQQKVSDDLIKNNDFEVKDAGWLYSNSVNIDRVLYHIGNSPFHAYMLPLIKKVPGTVVLHDFYISGLIACLDLVGGEANSWASELYQSHGYHAVSVRYNDTEEAKNNFPVNWGVIKNAKGVIVHSKFSCELAQQWLNFNIANEWRTIPLLRSDTRLFEKQAARKALKINKNDFIVCSYGFLGVTKKNHRLLNAWLKSSLAENQCCHLIFVGEKPKDEYGLKLTDIIKKSGIKKRIHITGFAAQEQYRQFLAAADLAVQLRTLSRGESSAAVLDCMNHGLPVVVNANGSMAELDKKAVWLMPDEFTDEELTEALEELWRNAERRKLMGEAAKSIIRELHSPEKCALQYAEAIEHFNQKIQVNLPGLVNQVAQSIESNINEKELINISEAIAKNHPKLRPAKQLLLDITETSGNNLKTGIERVANSLTIELINNPPKGYRIEPVYLSNRNGKWRYVYARQYTLSLLGISDEILEDEVACINNGDIILGLDISGKSIIESVEKGYINNLRTMGVQVYFILFDLLPIKTPSVFPPDADINHSLWLNAVASVDGIIAISKHVANDYASWINKAGCHQGRERSFKIKYNHLGADIKVRAASELVEHSKNNDLLNKIQKNPSFLMVGTVEPRKGYLYTLKAFEKLWRDGVNVNLVIVGKEGWLGLPDDMRRDIPETMHRLKTHDENGKRLFLLEGISDEFLSSVYAKSSCLIAASYDEGFGLPLIEAAQHKLPIIARDIPVFREVAGDHAFYFDGKEPEALSDAIQEWLKLYENNSHPRSDDMPWLTWKESAKNLMDIVLGKNS